MCNINIKNNSKEKINSEIFNFIMFVIISRMLGFRAVYRVDSVFFFKGLVWGRKGHCIIVRLFRRVPVVHSNHYLFIEEFIRLLFDFLSIYNN